MFYNNGEIYYVKICIFRAIGLKVKKKDLEYSNLKMEINIKFFYYKKGDFKQNKIEGFGIIIKNNGDFYEVF
jgi:hypothetical protein